MINIGKINTLRVVTQYPFGYALAPLVENNDENDSVIEIDDAEELQTVTLAIDEVEISLAEGQQIDVFVATDQRDLYATMKKPLIQVGETKVLKAVSATNFGAFFDWGLDNDLLMPNDYQAQPVNPGMYYVVHAFFDDKTQRILGATKLHYFLKENSAYLNEGDIVDC